MYLRFTYNRQIKYHERQILYLEPFSSWFKITINSYNIYIYTQTFQLHKIILPKKTGLDG